MTSTAQVHVHVLGMYVCAHMYMCARRSILSSTFSYSYLSSTMLYAENLEPKFSNGPSQVAQLVSLSRFCFHRMLAKMFSVLKCPSTTSFGHTFSLSQK